MHKETITYEDFDGNSVTEDFYFNLTKAEAIELELSADGGLSTILPKIIASKDVKKIVELFTGIMEKAYGVRSSDGRRFMKSPNLWDEFKETNAYSELYVRLLTSEDAGSAFMEAIMPKELVDLVRADATQESSNAGDFKSNDTEKQLEDYTDQELLHMPQEKFDDLVGTDVRSMSRDHMLIAFRRKEQRPVAG